MVQNIILWTKIRVFRAEKAFALLRVATLCFLHVLIEQSITYTLQKECNRTDKNWPRYNMAKSRRLHSAAQKKMGGVRPLPKREKIVCMSSPMHVHI